MNALQIFFATHAVLKIVEYHSDIDEPSLVVRRSRRILKDSLSRRIMHPMLVLIPEMYNQTNYKCLPMSYSRRIMRLWYKNGEDELSFWTDNASSSIKTTN